MGWTWEEKCKSYWFSQEQLSFALSLSHVAGRPPAEAEVTPGQGAFCFGAAPICVVVSLALIIARNSCFSGVQTCCLFLVGAGSMSEAMFEF